MAQWLEQRTRVKRSRVRVPAGVAGKVSSPGSTFCADSYFGICSTPVLPQQHDRKKTEKKRRKKETMMMMTMMIVFIRDERKKTEEKEERDDDDDHFYIALFSALEQTHCAGM